MTDIEILIQTIIDAEAEAGRNVWVSAQAIHTIFTDFGPYSRETFAILKTATKLSDDTLYNRRDAWAERTALEYITDDNYNISIDGLVANLTPSHFYRLHKARRSVDISNEEAYEYLCIAEATCQTAGGMVADICNNHDGDPAATFLRLVYRTVTAAQRILEGAETHNVPVPVRLVIKEFCLAMRNWANMDSEV